MIDIKYIRENSELVKKAALDKFCKVDIDRLLELDTQVREINKKLDAFKEERNTLSAKIPSLPSDDKQKTVEYVRNLKEKISELETEINPLKDEFQEIMYNVPSVPLDEVPYGKTDEDNVEFKKVGEIPSFNFEIKDHIDLAESLDLIDVPRATKISGSRSYFLKNEGLLLEMALCRYVIDKLVKKGFTPMSVPVMVKEEAMYGTSYFPGGREQAYAITEDELYLVGTSEVALVSYNSNETFESANELPKMYCGLSNCFRREAGTYGKDTRGLYRVHQFTKIEQVIMCEADFDKQYALHDFLLNNAEEILQDLKIPYRVVKVCTGDMGIGQVRKHDIEAWMPSRGKYSETHSCSSFNDFQSRRSNIKYKNSDGSTKFVFTLNNTAIASPRILIPILELYQNEDGSVTIPDVLKPYMNNMEKIEPKKRG
ncbi:MAG: serine--tRNA ligase [Clostridia bacterium]|nr:serine--tRNA ligase [Clostridia bacterium]